jgi:hypothetical protein
MRDTIISEMSSSYAEQINNYKTTVEGFLNSNTEVTSSFDITIEAEKNLDLMMKYHNRLELIENYFPVTGSSE